MEFTSENLNDQPKAVGFSHIALNYIFRSVHRDKAFGNIIFNGDNVSISSVISELAVALVPALPPTMVPPPPSFQGDKD
jgi:hypothetical protein